MNPHIEESVQFTALHASQDFLNYLQTNALIVDLWGLQGTMLTSSSVWHSLVSIVSVYPGLQRRLREQSGSRLSGSLGSSHRGLCGLAPPHTTQGLENRHFFLCWCLPHTTEGCPELNCSQPDLMVTGEGHIMLDTKKISTVMDTGQVCTFI